MAGCLPLALAGSAVAQAPAQTGAQVNGTDARALGLFVYPQKKQTAAEQQKDETKCYSSAQQQTGIDPQALAAPVPPAQAQAQPHGGAVGGAARGAAAGAAVGAIAGDAGTGAAVGAATGGVQGRRSKKQAQAQAQQQAAAQAQKAADDQLNTFKRAFTACMDARGYSVK
jgi:hypothetical protein